MANISIYKMAPPAAISLKQKYLHADRIVEDMFVYLCNPIKKQNSVLFLLMNCLWFVKECRRGQFIKHRCAQCTQCTHYHDRWLIHMLWIFEIYDSVYDCNCQEASVNHPKAQNHYAISFDPSTRKIRNILISWCCNCFWWNFRNCHIWLIFGLMSWQTSHIHSYFLLGFGSPSRQFLAWWIQLAKSLVFRCMSWILLGNPSATRAGLDEVRLGRMFMEVFLAWPQK